MSSDDEIGELVARCIEAWHTEGPTAVMRICQDRPEIADRVRKRLESLAAVGLLTDNKEGRVPTRLGEFRILRRIGGGGMGEVFLAEQETLGRQVALKAIRADQLLFAKTRQRFVREVETVAQLKHPSIVPVYAAGEQDGLPFFAMEYVEGATLAEVLERLEGRAPAELTGADLWCSVTGEDGPPPAEAPSIFRGSWVEVCLQITRDVANALEYAHGQGVLHRDLKSSNVMVSTDGRALLFDFGLASTSGEQRITRSGALVGTVPTMSPEQIRGEAIDHRSDVYSLGVTLYELLTLRPPFLRHNLQQTQAAVLRGEPESLRRHNPSLSWDVDTVCLTAMERDYARRYSTARDLATDIDNVLAYRTILARPPSASLRLRRLTQRHPAWTVGVVLGVTLLVSSVAFAWKQTRTNKALTVAIAASQASEADARDAAARAEASAQDAEQRAWALAEAAEKMLSHLGAVVLLDVPGMEEIRLEYVQEAVDLCQQFADSEMGNYRFATKTAVSLHSLGRVQIQSSRYDEAMNSLERALDLIANVESEMDPRELYLHRGHILMDRASLHLLLGNNDLAEGDYFQSIDNSERLLELQPDYPQALFRIGDASHQLGLLARGRGDYDEAFDWLEDARALCEDLEQIEPGKADNIELHAHCLINLNSLSSAAPREGYKDVLDQALELLAELIRLRPAASGPRENRAQIFAMQSMDAWRNEDLEEAARLLEQSIDEWQSVMIRFPSKRSAMAESTRWIYRMALIEELRGNVEEAETTFLEALRLARELAALGPNVVEREPIALCWQGRGEYLVKLGRTQESIEAWEEAISHYEILAPSDHPDDAETRLATCRAKLEEARQSR